MRIGLVRHFKVKQAMPEQIWVSPSELQAWLDAYDQADVEIMEADLGGIEWKVCYASTMPRAVTTAQSIYKDRGSITYTERLIEVPHPGLKGSLRLPMIVWAIWYKLVLTFGRRTRKEQIVGVKERISHVLDEIMLQPEQDVLLVSHASLMTFIRKELIARGFKGPGFGTPVNGKLYLFERKQ